MFLLVSFAANGAWAEPNLVRVCLNLHNNTPVYFQSGFYSTDFFDDGNATKFIQRGKICHQHLYKHGPKNLTVWVAGAASFSAQTPTIVLDKATCNDFYVREDIVALKSYRTNQKHEFWNFTLKQKDYLIFTLICERQS
ncbi:MAG: hypothetical protein H0W64_05060 [Gammaproteobacteria bacterium]|nr:hypothetical protein [Gammaproteobacteria bacterium]